VWVWITAGRT